MVELSIEELGGQQYCVLPVDGVVAIHHGAMLPSERRLSERLFSRKDGVSVLAVSPTLAQGVNLPADAIIIDGDDRWDEQSDSREALAAHEVLNVAGRAGRAGSSALGIVLLVPGGVVTFDEGTSSLEQRWFDLQERVFSKSDQCLVIKDPLQSWLDRLQLISADQHLDPEATYFLARLPVDVDGKGTVPREFLSRSLAAFHAKQTNALDKYDTLVSHVLSLRASTSGHAGTWHDNVSAATGISVEIIRELDEELSANFDINERSVLGWVSWWFTWLRARPQRALGLLGTKMFQRLFPDAFKGRGALANEQWSALIDRLEAVVVAWMNGAPLNQIEALCGAAPGKRGKCDRAREFAIRHAMSVAYGAGMIARVRRAQLAELESAADDVDAALPIALVTLHSCVREGFALPGQLALYEITGIDGARVRAHRRYAEVEAELPSGSSVESFADTRLRIRMALGEIA